MNWSRAKTILIFMFLATAIFQSFVLYNSERKTKNISPEIITSCTQLLKANQIEINPEIIPWHNYSLDFAEADNVIEDYKQFATLLLGEDIKKTEENVFSSAKGTVTFSGNSFDYRENEHSGEEIKTETSAQALAKETLKSLGFDLDDAKRSSSKTDTVYEITYTSYIDNTPVSDSAVTLLIQKDGISRISGKWFNITEKNGSSRLKTITSVLIDLIKADIDKPAKISGISLGYTIPENNSFQKSVALVPVWQIEFENGKQLLVDARSPQ